METKTAPRNLKEAYDAELGESQESAVIAVDMTLRMSKSAHDREFCRALERYSDQARDHAKRIGDLIHEPPAGIDESDTSAMSSLRTSLDLLLAAKADSGVTDAILLSLAQKAAHLQIAAYGTLCAWAKMIGDNHALQKLKPCLSEAKGFDARLSDIAEEFVNRKIKS